MKRARRGSIGAEYLLKLPRDLDDAVRADAKRVKISIAERWRRAGRMALAAPENDGRKQRT